MFPISRVTKDPQVRQAELMDTALELFLANGYQKTTVQDIVKHVNVAQGTFYYYFPSKEAILEAILISHVQNMIAEIQAFKPDNILEKLQFFINRFYRLSYLGEPGLISKVLYKEKQGLLINKLWRQTITITNPLLSHILEQCNQAGVTHVIHIDETLCFFGGVMAALLEASSPLEFGHESNPQILRAKLTIAEKMLETLFGASPGSIHLDEPQVI
ncbi:TetR/AcrR family transcriptional regulator [Sporomusa sphaeroides]|nr:TetR/AcrR family transcriptional regulator [Sporomusa sphaeroides]HML34560.1 TetR/AcrR family transcriptional regulator [Sporomusa sphaeroides]